jgi:cytochrome P450
MGRELALLEITTALQALRSRFPDMRVVEDGTVRYDKDNLFRTIQSLPVTRVPV